MIPVVNKTMDLTDCVDAWEFNDKHNVWMLEDVLYTSEPATPQFQRLSIFVPAAYMSAPGRIDPDGTINGYNANSAPVIFENNSAGYMQMPHVWLGGPRCMAEPYLNNGYIYVSAGNRGSDSKDENGKPSGKAPANLIDLKTAIRFLRHNKNNLPGDYDRIISIGWSAGGAMSMLLGVTGNNKKFDPYLKEAGAFMDESDSVFACQCYCPITDLENADMAYEWNFRADNEFEDSPGMSGGVMDEFSRALSGKLADMYIDYFNGLELVDEEGNLLRIDLSGRSGSAYDYLMRKLEDAATKYLARLDEGKSVGMMNSVMMFSAKEYISGNYKYSAPGEFRGPGPGENSEGPRLTLGEMLSRLPRGTELPEFRLPMVECRGDDKSDWLSYDGSRAKISDLDSYILNHRRRMKGCTAFDRLSDTSGENKVFGSPSEEFSHFSLKVRDALEMMSSDYPEESKVYLEKFDKEIRTDELQERVYLMNPLNYIGTDENSEQSKWFRIRVGTQDADTSFMVSVICALKLAMSGKSVDYEMVWDVPHWEADYEGEIIQWIDDICKRGE